MLNLWFMKGEIIRASFLCELTHFTIKVCYITVLTKFYTKLEDVFIVESYN